MNKEKAYSISFIVSNLIIWLVNAQIAQGVYKHYNEMLDGEPLPVLTEMVRGTEHIWPFIFIAVFMFAYYMAAREKNKAMHIILITALVEMVFLIVVAMAYFMPYTAITYSM